MNIEQFIYCRYKDSILSRREFKKAIGEKFRGLDINDIYARITKYQINKYGHALYSQAKSSYLPTREIERGYANMLRRRSYHGIHKTTKE